MTWTDDDMDAAEDGREDEGPTATDGATTGMTVSDVIAQLSRCPLDARVVIALRTGRASVRYLNIEHYELTIVDDDGRNFDTVVLWPRKTHRTEG